MSALDLLGNETERSHSCSRARGTGRFEWWTPGQYIEAAREVMGGIDLDPASCDDAQQTVQALRYFTVKDSGLLHHWRGRVWLNPPYRQPAIRQFIAKLLHELEAKRATTAILLTHNFTDNAWFHAASEACDALCFTRRRIPFEGPDGIKASPTQGQTFFYFGRNVERFAARFAEFGIILEPTSQQRDEMPLLWPRRAAP